LQQLDTQNNLRSFASSRHHALHGVLEEIIEHFWNIEAGTRRRFIVSQSSRDGEMFALLEIIEFIRVSDI
jgi:hypothetical protein